MILNKVFQISIPRSTFYIPSAPHSKHRVSSSPTPTMWNLEEGKRLETQEANHTIDRGRSLMKWEELGFKIWVERLSLDQRKFNFLPRWVWKKRRPGRIEDTFVSVRRGLKLWDLIFFSELWLKVFWHWRWRWQGIKLEKRRRIRP